MIPALRASCGEFTRTRPLLEGGVQVEGYTLRFAPDPYPPQGLLADYQARRNLLMTEERAFDVAELGLAPLVAAHTRGLELVAIPVFHYRRFRHGAIVCRAAARIRQPADLVGKRIGLRRLSLSAGVWARGLLQHEYGVPLDRIRWMVQHDTALRPEVRERLDVTVVGAEEPLERRLVRGELDAMIEAFAIGPLLEGSPLVHPLFEDVGTVEAAYYRRTGIFPVMHTVVLWRSVLERHPELPRKLHAAFVRAKALGAAEADRPTRYVLAEEEQAWLRGLSGEARAGLLGDGERARDPWAYSLREDGKTIEAFLTFAFEQGLTARRLAVEDLFAGTTLDL